MVGHGRSSAIPSHCASIVATSTLRVKGGLYNSYDVFDGRAGKATVYMIVLQKCNSYVESGQNLL